MIKRELRATVSSGLARPPTNTGSFPNFAKLKSFRAILGGIQFPAIHAAITNKTIKGMNRFTLSRSFSGGQNRPSENQIATANRRRRSRTRHKARESWDCGPPEELSRDRPVEIRLGKKFLRGNGAGDSCKSKHRGSRSAPDQSKLLCLRNSSESRCRRIFRG